MLEQALECMVAIVNEELTAARSVLMDETGRTLTLETQHWIALYTNGKSSLADPNADDVESEL